MLPPIATTEALVMYLKVSSPFVMASGSTFTLADKAPTSSDNMAKNSVLNVEENIGSGIIRHAVNNPANAPRAIGAAFAGNILECVTLQLTKLTKAVPIAVRIPIFVTSVNISV